MRPSSSLELLPQYLVPCLRFERRIAGCKPDVIAISLAGHMVGVEGTAPSSAEYKSAVLLLDDTPVLVLPEGIEPSS